MTIKSAWNSAVNGFESQLYTMNMWFSRLPADISAWNVIWNLFEAVTEIDQLPLAIPTFKEWNNAEQFAVDYFNRI